MNDRKQHVLKMAHQLFIEKGFQATSIQDILDYSGISKGTFYNYFSSKNELLITLLKNINQKLEQERNQLLIGNDPSDIEIFIKQVELHLLTNLGNKLVPLFEEVITSNDPELKQFLKLSHLSHLRWLYRRFIDLFGEEKKAFLLDCSIMFIGILQQNLKFSAMAHGSNENIHHIVRYSVNRIVHIVSEVSESGEQLIPPEHLQRWLPDAAYCDDTFHSKVLAIISELKNDFNQDDKNSDSLQLLNFIQEEFLAKGSRKFLIESAILSLKIKKSKFLPKLEKLESLIAENLSFGKRTT
jgi:AcrR family transcriptional regulator